MKKMLPLAVLALAACAAPPAPVAPASREPLAPVEAADPRLSQMLDAVLADWLAAAPDRPWQQDPAAPRVVVLLGGTFWNYRPNVPGIIVLSVDDLDGHSPPSPIRFGDTEYTLDYTSFYVQLARAHEVRASETPPPNPTRFVTLKNPLILRIDAISLSREGTEIEITLSQNNHHNLGSAGTTYKVTITKDGFKIEAGNWWMS